MPRTVIYDVLSNIEVVLRKDETNPATITVIYEVRSSEGDVVRQAFSPTLTSGEITQLRNFVRDTIIPQIKTREGLP